MSDTQNDNAAKGEAASSAQSTSGVEPEHAMYHYGSAGITEREGTVPVWLRIVVVSLLIWGLYYLVTNWNAPITPA